MKQTIFTIGHSTHSLDRFIGLLRMHRISAICDVRSQPYSRMNPQFNREDLKLILSKTGIAYVFLGKELGARSQDPSCYINGRVQYDRLAETELFRRGIQRLLGGSEGYSIALMCAEKEPLECHRTILVARCLFEEGLNIEHIHASGKLENHSNAETRLIHLLGIPEMFLPLNERRAEAYRRQAEAIAYSSIDKKDDEPVRSVYI